MADDDIANLNDQVLHLKVSSNDLFDDLRASFRNLATRLNTFPILFDDARIKSQKSQQSQRIDSLLSQTVNSPSELGRPSSIINEDDTQSQISSGSKARAPSLTPSKRKGTSEKTAKAWLLGWLMVAEMFYCHVTHHQFSWVSFVQFAHILVPKSEAENDPLVCIQRKFALSLSLILFSSCYYMNLY